MFIEKKIIVDYFTTRESNFHDKTYDKTVIKFVFKRYRFKDFFDMALFKLSLEVYAKRIAANVSLKK